MIHIQLVLRLFCSHFRIVISWCESGTCAVCEKCVRLHVCVCVRAMCVCAQFYLSLMHTAMLSTVFSFYWNSLLFRIVYYSNSNSKKEKNKRTNNNTAKQLELMNEKLSELILSSVRCVSLSFIRSIVSCSISFFLMRTTLRPCKYSYKIKVKILLAHFQYTLIECRLPADDDERRVES